MDAMNDSMSMGQGDGPRVRSDRNLIRGGGIGGRSHAEMMEIERELN